MALLDDIEERLDQYAVARIVGTPSTSTGMNETFASSGGTPALNVHLSDDGAGWSSKCSTQFSIVSTSDNRLQLTGYGSTEVSSTNTVYWAHGSTDTVADYRTVYVDVYWPDESVIASGNDFGAPGIGLVAWVGTGNSSAVMAGGQSWPTDPGVIVALFRSTPTAADLYYWHPVNSSSTGTANPIVLLTSGLSITTSSGYRLGMDIAGLTVTPWREPLGGATGSRVTYATQYLTTDPRDGNHRRDGVWMRAWYASALENGSSGGYWDNFRIQPYSSDVVWFLTKSYMPPDGDRMISIHETGGGPAEPKAPINYPTFQVRARAGTTQYSTAREKLHDAETALHGVSGATLNDWYYAGIWAQSDVLPIGFDPQDTRPVLAQNYRAARSRTS